jgi:hypothetical protein
MAIWMGLVGGVLIATFVVLPLAVTWQWPFGP